MSKRGSTHQTNIPRKIFMLALILAIMGFVAGAAHQRELAICLIVSGLITGFTAFGLRASDDG